MNDLEKWCAWIAENTGEERAIVDALMTMYEKERVRWNAAKRILNKRGEMAVLLATKMRAYLDAMNDARDVLKASPSMATWETYKIATGRVAAGWHLLAERLEAMQQ